MIQLSPQEAQIIWRALSAGNAGVCFEAMMVLKSKEIQANAPASNGERPPEEKDEVIEEVT